ncbi:hypothetical protein OA340_01115 [Paracoccaceae bacterium]|nr:hypothetical protein [Paracoccaceae bacterium]
MRLRQLVIATSEMDLLADSICDLFELKRTFSDPQLIVFGLENVLIPLGDTFLELVTPVKENTSAERFLKKRGGDGGYMVIVDSVDLEKERKRLENVEMDIVWHENRKTYGIHGQSLHLHPKQVGGAILSIDNMNPSSSWLWAGPEWEKDISQSLVSHLCGVNISSPYPNNLLFNWEKALGKKRSKGRNSIDLDGSNINFVMNTQSQSEHISAFQIHTVNKSYLEKRAASRGVLINNNIHLGGVDFLLVV